MPASGHQLLIVQIDRVGEQSRVRLYTRAERAGDLLVAADDRENGCAALTWAQWRAVGRERANVSREAVGCQGCPGV